MLMTHQQMTNFTLGSESISVRRRALPFFLLPRNRSSVCSAVRFWTLAEPARCWFSACFSAAPPSPPCRASVTCKHRQRRRAQALPRARYVSVWFRTQPVPVSVCSCSRCSGEAQTGSGTLPAACLVVLSEAFYPLQTGQGRPPAGLVVRPGSGVQTCPRCLGSDQSDQSGQGPCQSMPCVSPQSRKSCRLPQPSRKNLFLSVHTNREKQPVARRLSLFAPPQNHHQGILVEIPGIQSVYLPDSQE